MDFVVLLRSRVHIKCCSGSARIMCTVGSPILLSFSPPLSLSFLSSISSADVCNVCLKADASSCHTGASLLVYVCVCVCVCVCVWVCVCASINFLFFRCGFFNQHRCLFCSYRIGNIRWYCVYYFTSYTGTKVIYIYVLDLPLFCLHGISIYISRH